MDSIRTDQHLHGRMTEVIQRLKKLDSRLVRVTNGICGCAPEPGENPKSIDEHLHDKLNVALGVLLSLEDEMTRLENTVGSNQMQPKASGIASGY